MDLFGEILGYLLTFGCVLIVLGALTNFWVSAYITRKNVKGLMPLTPASFLGLLVVRVSLFILMASAGIVLFGLALGSFGTVLDFFKAAEYISAVVIITGAGATFLAAKIVIDWMDAPRAKYSMLLLLVSLIMAVAMILLSYESQMLFESTAFGVLDVSIWLIIVFVANAVISILIYLHQRVCETWFSHESRNE